MKCCFSLILILMVLLCSCCEYDNMGKCVSSSIDGLIDKYEKNAGKSSHGDKFKYITMVVSGKDNNANVVIIGGDEFPEKEIVGTKETGYAVLNSYFGTEFAKGRNVIYHYLDDYSFNVLLGMSKYRKIDRSEELYKSLPDMPKNLNYDPVVLEYTIKKMEELKNQK